MSKKPHLAFAVEQAIEGNLSILEGLLKQIENLIYIIGDIDQDNEGQKASLIEVKESLERTYQKLIKETQSLIQSYNETMEKATGKK